MRLLACAPARGRAREPRVCCMPHAHINRLQLAPLACAVRHAPKAGRFLRRARARTRRGPRANRTTKNHGGYLERALLAHTELHMTRIADPYRVVQIGSFLVQSTGPFRRVVWFNRPWEARSRASAPIPVLVPLRRRGCEAAVHGHRASGRLQRLPAAGRLQGCEAARPPSCMAVRAARLREAPRGRCQRRAESS